jgi:hypothetical protein
MYISYIVYISIDKMILLKGKILFDPADRTAKHKNQASWKKVAMVVFEGDVCEYYSWFIKKRYSLPLNKPLRGAHITFINDREGDITGSWEDVKAKYDGKDIEVIISIDPRTDADDPKSTGHWWLPVPEEARVNLQCIREELGLGRPFYGLHLSLGHANEKFKDHSAYIHRNIKTYGGSYK